MHEVDRIEYELSKETHLECKIIKSNHVDYAGKEICAQLDLEEKVQSDSNEVKKKPKYKVKKA